MIQTIPSNQRHHQDFGWLDARWHFSFGDYRDPANMNWGPLRVFNDDIIKGGGKFEPHPHRDMEIISYVVSGALAHEDSLGHGGVIRPGDVQVMSAGKGIVHSEANHSPSEPVHLMQIWIEPRTKGLTPRWEQKPFPREQRTNRLLAVVNGDGTGGALKIDQDATVYVSELEADKELRHDMRLNRRAYFFVISGECELNKHRLSAGDQGRVKDEASLQVRARRDCELILLDLP